MKEAWKIPVRIETTWGPYRMYQKNTGLNKYSDVLRVLPPQHIQDRSDVLPKY